jgi:uncharacterized protein (DUF2147 family)
MMTLNAVKLSGLVVLASTVLFTPAAQAAALRGIWANPSNSVHIAFHPCGHATCGKVVWANGKARLDARRSGTENLMGAALFRDFVQSGPDRWNGAVFVPDIGRNLTGTLEMVDDHTLRGRGCIMPGFGCKSQTWKRIN